MRLFPARRRPRLLGHLAVLCVLVGCDETRRPIGEECLRSEDCLSGVCSARACGSTPPVAGELGAAPPNDEPRIPDGGRLAQAPDATSEGG
jgi:hypothetical protein